MTTLNVNTITPAGATLTLGASGDTIVAVDDVKFNTVKDAGGNTLWVSDGSGSLSSVNSAFGGGMKLILTQTASNSAYIDFTSNFDSTYKEYIFKFININPVTDNTNFVFSTGTPLLSNGLSVMTTTSFCAYHDENDTQTGLVYTPSIDQAQGDAYQELLHHLGNDADASGSGELHFFNPGSTTYVKNWYSKSSQYDEGNTTPGREWSGFIGGYMNQTGVTSEIRFKMDSGNFDGTIKMYGIA